MSHIAGPWEIGKQNYGDEFDWCVMTEKLEVIADVGGPRSALNDVTGEIVVIGREAGEIEATVRLIAAAPELLECCIRARTQSARVHADFAAQLAAAIAKATGAAAQEGTMPQMWPSPAEMEADK